MNKIFLTAEWRKLVIANYSFDPEILKNYIPNKTELDKWNEITYVSLVGFMFLNTRIKGFRIPFHVNFEEVNLRFYVLHKDKISNQWKRGVVFIKEIVPKRAIVFIANNIFKENYEAMKMKHQWTHSQSVISAEYQWESGKWNSFKVNSIETAYDFKQGSEEEFITEHYWGYTKINNSDTSEYNVQHPKWKMYPVSDYEINVDFAMLYGNEFASLKNNKPLSVFFAEGSEIKVGSGRII